MVNPKRSHSYEQHSYQQQPHSSSSSPFWLRSSSSPPNQDNLNLVVLLLALWVAYNYKSLRRLLSAFYHEPEQTVHGLVEMVGHRLTASLGESKQSWSASEGDVGSEGKPIRRYQDLLGPTLPPGAPALQNSERSPQRRTGLTIYCGLQARSIQAC